MGLVAIAWLLALVLRSLVLGVFVVQSTSMEPTLHVGDRVLVARLPYAFIRPRRGHIVALKEPESRTRASHRRTIIKRVHDVIDGAVYSEGGSLAALEARGRIARLAPERQIVVLGDNRDVSRDSRLFGPVGQADIVGRVVAVVWPLRHVRFLG